MSAAIRLSSKLPGDDEINGVDHLAPNLEKDPHQVLVCLTWIDVPKVTHDVDADTDVPTIRIRRIEPIATVEKVPDEIIKLAAELHEARTGKRALPFDVIDTRSGGYVSDAEQD